MLTRNATNPMVYSKRTPEKIRFSIENALILIILLAVSITLLLCVYKWIMSQRGTITPQEMEINKATQIAKAYPESPNARLPLAYAYQKNGDFQKALELYNQVLSVDPKNLAAIYNVGIVYKEQQNLSEAEKQLKKAIELKSDHILAACALGEIYISQKKYDKAILVLNQAINKKSSLVNPRLLKAKALELKGDKKGALAEYKKVLQFIPDQLEANSALKRLSAGVKK